MFRQALSKLSLFISRFGADESDSDELRLQKQLAVSGMIVALTAILLWGIICWFFNERQAVLILAVQGILTFLSLFLFGIQHQSFRMFYLSQFSIQFVMNFLVMLALGGMVNSSMLITWLLIIPFGMLILSSVTEATYWFIGYVVLILLSIFLQPYLRIENNLPSLIKTVLLGVNLVIPSCFIFFAFNYFIGQKNKFYGLLCQEQEKSERAYELLSKYVPSQVTDTIYNGEIDSVSKHHRKKLTFFFSDIK